MAREIVDYDIEEHLLEKIRHGIQRKGDKPNLISRCYSLDADFIELKNLLSQTTNANYKGNWLSGRRENLYCLNNLLNEWQMIKKRSSFAPVEDREACANIKKSLKKMLKELKGEESSSRGEQSFSRHQDPERTIFSRNTKEVYRWSSRHGPRKVHGFEVNIMAMERDLVLRKVDAPFKVFGVTGVVGVGKTTLCQAIFNRDLVKKHFCLRIWVCLSKQPRDNKDYRKEIVVRILKSIGVEDEVIDEKEKDGDENGLRKLVLLLRLQLIGKRYLLVLDDAWKDDDEFFLQLARTETPNMNELAYALPKGCGGTIICSSRSDVLLKKMLGKDVNLQSTVGKDVSLQYLKPHTPEMIEAIFRDAVIGYDEEKREFPSDFEELKKEILDKCDGIPLAANLLAKIARQPPLMLEAPPKTSTSGVQEIEEFPDSGGEKLKGGADAGSSGSGAHDGEDKGGVLLDSKQKDVLTSYGPDQVA